MMSKLSTMVVVQKYNSLLDRMEGLFFSWAMAKQIVGGENRLKRLMDEEKIHGYKPDGAANSKWRINAVEVLSNVKPRGGKAQRGNKSKTRQSCFATQDSV